MGRMVVPGLFLAFFALLVYGGRRGEAGRGEAKMEFFSWHGNGMPRRLEKPRGVALDASGIVRVLDIGGRVARFSEEGVYMDEVALPENSLGNPQYLNAGAGGTFLIADTHYHQILRLTADGALLPVIGNAATSPEQAAPGELYWPCSAVESADGFIYTAEYGGHDRIQKWTNNGIWLAAWGGFGTGPGQFRRPAGMALDGEGLLYVADAANNRVQVFTAEGEFVQAWDASDSPHGRLDCPYDIKVDSHGYIVVLEFAACRLRWFTPQGKEIRSWGGPSRGGEGLSYPWGFAVGPGDSFHVADTGNNRIARLSGRR